jgi:hypothetical protein
MSKYVFVGSGAGVPGLPHELTDEEAREPGVKEILRGALKAGTYKEVKPEKKTSKKELSDG